MAGSIARRIASYSALFGINFSLVEGQTVDVSQGFPVMGRFLLFKDTGREARLIYGSLPAIGISLRTSQFSAGETRLQTNEQRGLVWRHLRYSAEED